MTSIDRFPVVDVRITDPRQELDVMGWMQRRGVVAVQVVAARTADQTRTRVSRALRVAITRVTAALPEAGRVLERRVHTGALCVYEPDPDDEIAWSVHLAA